MDDKTPEHWQEPLEDWVLKSMAIKIKDADQHNAEFVRLPKEWREFVPDVVAKSGWDLSVVTCDKDGAEDPNGTEQEYRLVNPRHEE